MEKKLRQKPINLVKVVLFGPESSGKTTLSRQLARYYNTVWAPEFAREYLQEKWNNERKTCEQSDLLPIAVGQMNLENRSAVAAHFVASLELVKEGDVYLRQDNYNDKILLSSKTK